MFLFVLPLGSSLIIVLIVKDLVVRPGTPRAFPFRSLRFPDPIQSYVFKSLVLQLLNPPPASFFFLKKSRAFRTNREASIEFESSLENSRRRS